MEPSAPPAPIQQQHQHEIDRKPYRPRQDGAADDKILRDGIDETQRQTEGCQQMDGQPVFAVDLLAAGVKLRRMEKLKDFIFHGRTVLFSLT